MIKGYISTKLPTVAVTMNNPEAVYPEVTVGTVLVIFLLASLFFLGLLGSYFTESELLKR